MSVTVRYKGRFGNNVFQYVCGRLFAENNGLQLRTPFCEPEILPMEPEEYTPDDDEGPEITLGDQNAILDRPWGPGRYVLDGFFQRSDWYYARRDSILAFARPRAVEKRPLSHIAMHVRLEDYHSHGIVIDPRWYCSILEKESFDRLFIVGKDLTSDWLRPFLKWNPIVISRSPSRDFDFLRRFDRVICSNSTFAWWAVFFSRPAKIWTFKRWIQNPMADLAGFPGAEVVDGPFLGEA